MYKTNERYRELINFTPTYFRNNSSDVFNEVQKSGAVVIKSHSRPEMVLCTKEVFDSANEKSKANTGKRV